MRDSERAVHQLQDWIERIFEGADRCWEIEHGRTRWQRFRDALTGRDVREEVISCVCDMHRRNAQLVGEPYRSMLVDMALDVQGGT